MSYVRKTLSAGEEIQLWAKLHWINYLQAIGLWVVAVLILGYYLVPEDYDKTDLLWLVMFFGVWGGYLFLKLWTMEMAVTNKRVVLRRGIIGIDSDEIKNLKIEGIEVEQPVLGRILNYGDVCFSGVGVGRLVFKNICRPWEVKSQVEDIVGE